MSSKRIYWLTQNISNLPKNDVWLTPAEFGQLSKFKILRRKFDWKLGRWTAKTGIIEYLKKTSHTRRYPEIEIRPAADGAPEAYIGNRIASFTISLSHRSGTALCTIDPDGLCIGCDIEKVERRSAAFIEDYFTINEKDWTLGGSDKDRIIFSNVIWSAKESALKMLREGLRLDTRLVEIQIKNHEAGGDWETFRVNYKKGNRTFYGCWKMIADLVITIVSPVDSFDLINLREI